MAGVGQGREHRLDLFDERTALQDLREVRHAAHARDVGGTEGINTEYKDFRHRFSFLLERRRVWPDRNALVCVQADVRRDVRLLEWAGITLRELRGRRPQRAA